jgi:hypothetical protein
MSVIDALLVLLCRDNSCKEHGKLLRMCHVRTSYAYMVKFSANYWMMYVDWSCFVARAVGVRL